MSVSMVTTCTFTLLFDTKHATICPVRIFTGYVPYSCCLSKQH